MTNSGLLCAQTRKQELDQELDLRSLLPCTDNSPVDLSVRMAEAGDCWICVQPLANAGRLACIQSCGHIFHLECLSKSIRGDSHCRMCEQPFSEFDEIDSEGETVNTFIFQVGCRSRDSEEDEDEPEATSFHDSHGD